MGQGMEGRSEGMEGWIVRVGGRGADGVWVPEIGGTHWAGKTRVEDEWRGEWNDEENELELELEERGCESVIETMIKSQSELAPFLVPRTATHFKPSTQFRCATTLSPFKGAQHADQVQSA
ncbi:hypothetical protein ONZ45_g13234 [Pleurotus djamor]|nr:hypothetical protein ONZ45_g13234 [Pleurotus djamor]